MPQFNLTEEDESLTRADVAEMLKDLKKGDNKREHVKKKIKDKDSKHKDIPDRHLAKLLDDLDSY